MQCFPFLSILMGLGNPTVDFFSLDVEGAEVPILRSIPFDKVKKIRNVKWEIELCLFLIKKRLTSGCS